MGDEAKAEGWCGGSCGPAGGSAVLLAVWLRVAGWAPWARIHAEQGLGPVRQIRCCPCNPPPGFRPLPGHDRGETGTSKRVCHRCAIYPEWVCGEGTRRGPGAYRGGCEPLDSFRDTSGQAYRNPSTCLFGKLPRHSKSPVRVFRAHWQRPSCRSQGARTDSIQRQ